jgi:ParB family chromosome partitioning protein
LLQLPEDIQVLVRDELLTAGHARALLAVTGTQQQKKAAQLIIDKDLSVRETEKLVKRLNLPPKEEKKQDPAYVLSVKDVERRLAGRLGTRVKLKDRQGKGSIQIEYYSNDDLERLLELIDRS